MVRNYVPKTNRSKLNERHIKRAVRAIFKKYMSQREAATLYNITRPTLQSRIRAILKKTTIEEYLDNNLSDDDGYDSEEEKTSKYATRNVFSLDKERELVEYIKKSANINYGLTYKQIRIFVADFAKCLACKYPPSWDNNGQAGMDWLQGFMKRNDDISLRKPENTSLARGIGFNRSKVNEFFENYSKLLKKYSFTPEKIFNLDETGVQTVLRPPKIVAPKGKKQVGLIASGEKGETVTIVGIINAIGQALPPVYIFPRIRT